MVRVQRWKWNIQTPTPEIGEVKVKGVTMKHQKLWKKVVSCMLASIMAVSCLVGCGEQNQEESKTPSSQEKTEVSQPTSESKEPDLELGYPIKDDVTLTIAWPVEAAVTAHAADLSETAFGKEWQERTGVNIEIVSYADASALNMLLSSGELPDIIYGNLNSYPGGAAGAVEDGLIQPINDYMQYAPDLQAVFDEDESVYRDSMTGNGDIIGFLHIRPGKLTDLVLNGLLVRNDWLDELKLKAPTNADELYNVLKAFKEEKGVKHPLTGTGGMINRLVSAGIITSPFNLPMADFHNMDGEIHYGYYEDEMKDVLAYMNKLVEEELLNPNYATLDNNAVTADMLNGVSGMAMAQGSRAYIWYNGGREVNPEYDIVAIPSLQTPDGQLGMGASYDKRLSGNGAYITTDCENIEAAVRLLNYGNTDEGALLFHDGIEGINYEVDAEGYQVHMDGTSVHPDWTSAEINGYYKRGWAHGPYIMREVYPERIDENTARMYAAKEEFAKTQVSDYVLPTLQNYMSYEDAQEISKLMAEIETYKSEMVTKFILGTESLDNFEEFQKTMKDMGIEKVIEIYQKAYSLFDANK